MRVRFTSRRTRCGNLKRTGECAWPANCLSSSKRILIHRNFAAGVRSLDRSNASGTSTADTFKRARGAIRGEVTLVPSLAFPYSGTEHSFDGAPAPSRTHLR